MRSFNAKEPNTAFGSTLLVAALGLSEPFLPFFAEEAAPGLIILTRIFFAAGAAGLSFLAGSPSFSPSFSPSWTSTTGSSSETSKDGTRSSSNSTNSFSFSSWGKSIFLSISLGFELPKVKLIFLSWIPLHADGGGLSVYLRMTFRMVISSPSDWARLERDMPWNAVEVSSESKFFSNVFPRGVLCPFTSKTGILV